MCFSPEEKRWVVGGTLQVLGQGKAAWLLLTSSFFPSHDQLIGVAAQGTASFVLSVTPSSIPL